MYLLQVSKQERIWLSQAKAKILKNKPQLNKLTDGMAVHEALKYFVGKSNGKRRNNNEKSGGGRAISAT